MFALAGGRYVCVYICVRICIFILIVMQTHNYIHMYIFICIHIIYVYIYIYVCMYVYIYTCVLCPVQVPQQWIGSSVALAMEVGSFSVQPRVAVKVFDWGRAELNTARDFNALAAEEKETRARYWRQYLQSLVRMYWELGRLVAHRCCCPAWSVLVMELRAFAPVVLRAALLGESLTTSQEPEQHCNVEAVRSS